jgi:uncharacterized membrane protein YcaP (DUF421 family)
VLHAIFHLQTSVGEKVLRSVLIYVFVIAAFRLFGKRELGQANTLDLAVLMLLANAVQNGIIGNDVSVTGAVLGGVVLLILNRLLERLNFHVPGISTVLEGTPTALIEDGKPNVRALRREMISLPELRAIARRQGFPDLGEVKTAILETNGVVSMFRESEPQLYHPAEAGGLRIGKRRRHPATAQPGE